ncbi:MAG: S1 family peptidase [Microcella sp.]
MRFLQFVSVVQIVATGALAIFSAGTATNLLPQGKSLVSSLDGAFSENELSDLGVWAAHNGMTLDEAARRFTGQMEFMRLAHEVELSQPELFVEAEWFAGVEPHGILRVVGAPTDSLRELLTQTKVDVTVEGGYRLSAQDFDNKLADIYFTVASAIGEENVTASGKPSAGAIEIVVAEHVRSEWEGALSLIVESVSPELAVAVSFAKFPQQGGAEGIVGGRQWGQCTAGFSVRRGSVYGMTTAQHCRSVGLSTAYQGTAMTSPSAPIELSTSSGDIKWRRTVSVVADPLFQAAAGTYRMVSSTLNPVVGTAICKYGVTTGQTCSTVAVTSMCANGYCGLTRVFADISEPGDSGGPWFFGNTAMGIHHGTAAVGPYLYSAFTRIGGVNALNLLVLTG